MSNNSSRGSAETDLLWVVGLLVLLFILWIATGGPRHWEATSGPFIKPPAPLDTGEVYGPTTPRLRGASPQKTNYISNPTNDSISPYTDTVRLQQGNQRYTTRTNEEYIIITNDYGDGKPVNLTGWKLMNGKNRRGGYSDLVTIPFGVKTFVAGGNNYPRDQIILEPGGRAIVTTGKFNRTSPFPINTSFFTNTCSGYLEDLKNYNFYPSLRSRCPVPDDEGGTMFIDDKCYEFVRKLSSCHQPEYYERQVGDDEIDYVDNQVDNLSRSCKLYLADHFNYSSCVKWHAADSDFYGSEWRVFLNWPRELWDDGRETISLFDQSGRLVDELSY